MTPHSTVNVGANNKKLHALDPGLTHSNTNACQEPRAPGLRAEGLADAAPILVTKFRAHRARSEDAFRAAVAEPGNGVLCCVGCFLFLVSF